MIKRESANKVCVVTVTYGNRWHLVKRVKEAIKSQSAPVSRIIIVDNGSTLNRDFDDDSEIEIIKLDKNYGSAAGYRAGLVRAYQTECDLIWLLDDDNKPHNDALGELLSARKRLGNNEYDCFASLRLDREKYTAAVFKNKEVQVTPNSFMRLTARSIFAGISHKLLGTQSAVSANKLASPIKRIEYAIYGGFLFSRKWIMKIGYPDENYFTYMDDVDYTTRIIRAGGNIYLVATSTIKDLDNSLSRKNSEKYHPIINSEVNKVKNYYNFRNTVYLENKYFVTNKFIYFLNMIIVISYLFLLEIQKKKSIFGSIMKFQFLISAIKDGFKKNMGCIEGISENKVA